MAERKWIGAWEILGTNNKLPSEMSDEELEALAETLAGEIVDTITMEEDDSDEKVV